MLPVSERFFGALSALRCRPDAQAVISGSAEYPGLHGVVRFYQTSQGVLVAAEVRGLPQGTGPCAQRFFAFHIHSGGRCSGNAEHPFADADGHYNPDGCPHPNHRGDLPPLLGNHGRALQVFLTDHFRVREVLGKTVIVHAGVDDFTSQPSGNAGTMIACGEIQAARRCR